MSWTDERVETLKTLWTEGLSASQIAKQLGGVSRNAVIGKVHRLGLEGRNKPGAAPAKPRPAEASPDEVASPAAEIAPVRTAEPEATDANDAPGEEPVREAANDSTPGTDDDVVVPIPRKLKLTELNERTCKWPIGDPMHDDFHFCGNESDEGRPYCEYHAGLAFQPASERRRVR